MTKKVNYKVIYNDKLKGTQESIIVQAGENAWDRTIIKKFKEAMLCKYGEHDQSSYPIKAILTES